MKQDTSASQPDVFETMSDTLRTDTLVRVGNDSYPLRLSGCRMVHALIAHGKNDFGEGVHEERWRIQFDYGEHHLDTVLTNEQFSDSLAKVGMEDAVFTNCRFDFVRSNAIYLVASFWQPITDHVAEVSFLVFYQGPKFGTIYYLVVPEQELKARQEWLKRK